MPVIRALEALGLPPAVLLTGQHTGLLEGTLADLGIEATDGAQVQAPEQPLAALSARILTGVHELLARHRPRLLLVQGDTSSVALAALAAFYEGVGVAHVEAGLRSGPRR
jgi:UDP-N-acetylglucosamine 2-epimerase (non-hydrolysing)